MTNGYDSFIYDKVKQSSPTVAEFLLDEMNRQDKTIELIASENFVSDAIKAVCGSCFTNKYAEGYPVGRRSGREGRYYGGTQNVDNMEECCCNIWRKVFNTDYHVNVQPHSGSQANFAAYMSVLQPEDTILSMNLNNGSHLTHGSSVNFSGKLYNFVFYGVDSSCRIDYDDIYKKIIEHRPSLVVAGASAYSREINFAKIKSLIDFAEKKLGYRPYFMVDMAHIAGLVAAGFHQSPFGLADIITTTTHKTLRGPRGGMIFCREYLANKIDGAVFPGSQGGPLEHIIAGKAICAEEALRPEYRDYIRRVVNNSKTMANEFIKMGYNVVTGGTDNHLFLLDFLQTHPTVTGKMVQDECDRCGITLNKNCVPDEVRSPKETSGIRVGTAAMTTKGFAEEDFVRVAHQIDEIIRGLSNNCK